MFLTEDEIIELTKKTRRSSQRAVLNSLGIVHKVRPDGSLVVASAHANKVFGVTDDKRRAAEKEPNWGALAHA